MSDRRRSLNLQKLAARQAGDSPVLEALAGHEDPQGLGASAEVRRPFNAQELRRQEARGLGLNTGPSSSRRLRFEPGRFVEAGDPRSRDGLGDGWGGPGYTLRDEITMLPARRGALAMAASQPDTAGSRFLILLSDQPQLDGKLTVFGEVVGGWEVLDAIEQGERIAEVREAEPRQRR